ncbi:MAG: Lrp/AsnC ligand binding domain-containing protein [Candidatus Pacearchaeota archaeon]
MVKPAAYLLIKTKENSFNILKRIRSKSIVVWADVVYGPYQIVAYVEAENDIKLAKNIEKIRVDKGIEELDARMVKIIPKDEELKSIKITKQKLAVLLINVNYKEEKERVVTWNLRKLNGVVWARAMWGPADIIAIVEADDHESMRNLICDKIKTMKGVLSNTTLYCYPSE